MAVADDRRRVKVSKYLSRHLRHQPERLGLTLGPGGWVDIDDLLTACRTHGFTLTRAELDDVVATNDKRRFTLDPSGTRIRAAQGHSVDVDLGLDPAEPPAVLFHGTGRASLPAILDQGLRPMGRRHVHLSADEATAVDVGRRHGPPVVLTVDAGAMAAAGWTFSQADNGVWLVDAVPPAYMRAQANPRPPPRTPAARRRAGADQVEGTGGARRDRRAGRRAAASADRHTPD
jgi:putative RNA 2'-phosphotransferase